jgi:site-specific DNA-methyltransferase (adenine-specific)
MGNGELFSSQQNHEFRHTKSVTKLTKKGDENSRSRGRPRKHRTHADRQAAYRRNQQKLGKNRLVPLKIQTPPLPQKLYRVIYADPPWKYSSDGLRKYGHAAFHYPSLTIEEICSLKIKSILEESAVLFIWVTSPMLEDCFKVIKAWGFEYKTSIIWDKMRHNYGSYVSVQHEFLLICTKGSCRPDIGELYDSTVSTFIDPVTHIKRGKHSEKPKEFRELIDKLYLLGERIELFARTCHEGWDHWGNELFPITVETGEEPIS